MKFHKIYKKIKTKIEINSNQLVLIQFGLIRFDFV